MSVQEHLDALPEDWQRKFLEMYDTGCSDHEVMREFAISPKAWKLMSIALGESEFNEVIEFGKALARAWWEREGRVNLDRRGFNTRLYDINMQNRWGWARKAENAEVDQVTGADEQSLDRRIEELKAKVSGEIE
jgi:hypothetical protein